MKKFEIPEELRQLLLHVPPRPEGTALRLSDLNVGTRFQFCIKGSVCFYGKVASSPYSRDGTWRIDVLRRCAMHEPPGPGEPCPHCRRQSDEEVREEWSLYRLGVIPQRIRGKTLTYAEDMHIEYRNRLLRFLLQRNPIDPAAYQYGALGSQF